jgi:hypothetical protein
VVHAQLFVINFYFLSFPIKYCNTALKFVVATSFRVLPIHFPKYLAQKPQLKPQSLPLHSTIHKYVRGGDKDDRKGSKPFESRLGGVMVSVVAV